MICFFAGFGFANDHFEQFAQDSVWVRDGLATHGFAAQKQSIDRLPGIHYRNTLRFPFKETTLVGNF